jgi:hypothetical protein
MKIGDIKIVDNFKDYKALIEVVYVGKEGVLYEHLLVLRGPKKVSNPDWSSHQFVRDPTPEEVTKYLKYFL